MRGRTEGGCGKSGKVEEAGDELRESPNSRGGAVSVCWGVPGPPENTTRGSTVTSWQKKIKVSRITPRHGWEETEK